MTGSQEPGSIDGASPWRRAARRALGIAACACLVASGLAAAQEDPGGDDTEVLDKVFQTRAKGNDAGVKTQKRIDEISDETDELLAEYRTKLKQIDAIELYNSQMRQLISAQQAELGSLAGQLDRVEEVGRSVTPLMLRMIDALEQFVELDVPFLIDERRERVATLRRLMNRADVTTPEKFRQIMEAYQIENEYGRTIEAYRDTIELDGKEVTVDFLRFGRIALVFQSLDESQSGAWDQEAREWIALDSSYRSPIREGLRIARKQAAPDLIELPLPAPREAS